jgi:Nuclease-related domain
MVHREDTDEGNGTAGASARREYERRKTRREERARAAHPRIGGFLLRLNGTPQHVERWSRGAEGEELVARALAARCNELVVLLHDRRLPGTRANIDHIAVAPSGVWVIDTKRYKGKVEVKKELFGAPALRIGGSDRTKLVAGLAAQVDAVKQVVEAIDRGIPVHGCFCFVDADLPLLSTPTIAGFFCLSRNGLAKRLNASGPVARDRASLLAQRLRTEFPGA